MMAVNFISHQEPRPMLDLIAIAVTILFFALALWYVRFCEKI
jgi:hypothetical protein